MGLSSGAVPRCRDRRRIASMLALCLALGACRQDGMHECRSLLEADDAEAAVRVCEARWTATGDPRAGAAAAEAHKDLGHREEVLAWLDRLQGTTGEARLWSLVAAVHLEADERQPAAEAYRQALALHRRAGDHRPAAKSLYGLFYLAWLSSDYRPALESLEAATLEATLAADRETEAKALQAMVVLRYDLGDLEGAQRVLDHAMERASPEERSIQARLLSHVGMLQLNRGRRLLGVDALERALERSTGEEGRGFLRTVHLNLTEANLELGELEEAERHLAAAWEQAEPDGRRRTGLLIYKARIEHRRGRLDDAAATLRTAFEGQPSIDWAWRLRVLEGTVAEARGEPDAAIAAYRRAAALIEELRRSMGLDELKSWVLDRKRQPYEALFRLHLAADRPHAAVAALENAKARSFLDAFIQATAPQAAAATGAAAERLDALQRTLPVMSESPVVAPRPLEDVLDAVADRHVLVYFQAEEHLWLVVVAGGQIVPYPLAASPDEVGARISRLLAAPGEPSEAADLARVLLPPGSLPEPGSELYVVADGALGDLPFAALRRDGRYLVEDHDILYVPSLSSLASLADRPREPAGARDRQAFVGGDPGGDLPAAAAEAAEVAAALGAAGRVGEALTLASLLEARQAPAWHLATHGGAGPRGPWLALADGELNTGTIIRQRLAPPLVVLASCGAAARRGKGMWGSLGGAFLAAGSRAVVASLWSIEDRPTRRFILRFYHQDGARDPAGALARVQRAAIAGGEPATAWAPFVVFGTGLESRGSPAAGD